MMYLDDIYTWLLSLTPFRNNRPDYIEFSTSQIIFDLWRSGKILGDPPQAYKLYQMAHDKKIRDSAPYAMRSSIGGRVPCAVCGNQCGNHYKELPCGKYAVICVSCERMHDIEIYKPLLKKFKVEIKKKERRIASVTIDARRIPISTPEYIRPSIHIVDIGITPEMSCCKILKKHHDALKDDTERLSTEFIKKMSKCSCDEKLS
jgi:hypothetical protein